MQSNEQPVSLYICRIVYHTSPIMFLSIPFSLWCIFGVYGGCIIVYWGCISTISYLCILFHVMLVVLLLRTRVKGKITNPVVKRGSPLSPVRCCQNTRYKDGCYVCPYIIFISSWLILYAA